MRETLYTDSITLYIQYKETKIYLVKVSFFFSTAQVYAHSVCVFCALRWVKCRRQFQVWFSNFGLHVWSIFFSYKCDRHPTFSFPVNHLIIGSKHYYQ